jgi:hypothetical protein
VTLHSRLIMTTGLHKKSAIPPTAVGGLLKVRSKDLSSETHGNPTHGSGWILQVVSENGLEQSAHCRGWDLGLFVQSQ